MSKKLPKWVAENKDLLLGNKSDEEIQEFFPQFKVATINRARRQLREQEKKGLFSKLNIIPLTKIPDVVIRLPKILVLDIETSYLIIKAWGMYEQNALSGYAGVLQDWQILTIAYSWYGETKKIKGVDTPVAYVKGQDDFPDYVPGVVNDKSLMAWFYEIWNEADVVIAHNGLKFDFPKIRTRYLQNDFDPCRNPEEVDTLRLIRSRFANTSNKQGDLAIQLKLDQLKDDPGGIKTWDGCQSGDPKSWKKMKSYNKQDVVGLTALYKKVMPWAKTHPNLAQLLGDVTACPKCGASEALESTSFFKHTSSNSYEIFRCTNCKGLSRSRTALKNPEKVNFVS